MVSVATIPQRDPPGRPARWKPLLELALMFGVAVAVDMVLGDGTRFRSVQPHPFWIPVLLFAVQYGTAHALLASGVGALVLLVDNVPPQGLAVDLHTHLLQVTLNPILWLVASLVLGGIRDRARSRTAALDADLRATADRERTLTDAYGRLRATKEELEIRVAGQMRTVLTIYRAARSIERLNFGEVLIGISDLVREVTAPRKFSLFLLNQGVLEAVVNEGWTPEDRYARTFDDGSPLFRSVVGGQQVLCAVRADDQRLLSAEGLLAGPLVSADTGEVVGMLKIESLDFIHLNAAAIENMRMLCEWIGTAFAKAQLFEAAQEDRMAAPESNLLSGGLFDRDSAVLTAIARRMKFALSMLAVSVEVTPGTDVDVARVMGEASHEVLRNTDSVFDQRRTGNDFAVLLPGATAATATIVADRIRASIEKRIPADRLALSVRIHVLNAVAAEVAP